MATYPTIAQQGAASDSLGSFLAKAQSKIQTKKDKTMILVTGATGQLGAAVIHNRMALR